MCLFHGKRHYSKRGDDKKKRSKLREALKGEYEINTLTERSETDEKLGRNREINARRE